MDRHEGGCLCGDIRYETLADPIRVTFCHCRFCQRATGSAYMLETIFRRDDYRITRGIPCVYELRSAGSGKMVYVHFCQRCGTRLHLSFERSPENYGVYSGTFDDPDWFEIEPRNSRHIFLDVARPGTIIPPATKSYGQHVMNFIENLDLEPTIFQEAHVIPRRG